MNDNRLLNELVEGRVEKRMRQVKRFGIHLVGGIGLVLLAAPIASEGLLPDMVTLVLVLGIVFSILVHAMWLALGSAREAITREEIERVQRMYPELAGLSLEAEKPKRTGSALAEDAEDEPIDLDLLADEEKRHLSG